MSILIKGMEMPKNCHGCWITDYCLEYHFGIFANGNGKPCPLVEIPTPHGRLIDADAIRYTYTIARSDDDGHNWIVRAVERDEIDDMPTIIEAEGGTNNG